MNVNRGGIKILKNKKMRIVLAIIIIIVFLMILKDPIQKIIYPKTYKEVVSVYNEQYNVDENLIFAVIKAESNFDPNTVSEKGAIGLMQLMPDTAKEIAVKNGIDLDEANVEMELSNINKNINIGSKYLSILLQKYNNIELALAAYNAGIGTVDSWIEKGIIKEDGSDIENIPYKETNQYVRKILRDFRIYDTIYRVEK